MSPKLVAATLAKPIDLPARPWGLWSACAPRIVSRFPEPFPPSFRCRPFGVSGLGLGSTSWAALGWRGLRRAPVLPAAPLCRLGAGVELGGMRRW